MKRAFAFAVSLVCLLTLLICGMQRAEAADTSRYGYSLLTNDNQRKAYAEVADGIGALDTQITFTISGVTQENANSILNDVKIACQMIVRDYPEFFWFSGAFKLGALGDQITVTPAAYTINGQTVTAGSAQLTSAKQQLETAIEKARATIPANPSHYDIAHALHDYLIKNVTYVKTGDHQTAYGALVSGNAVCAGYARAYQLLLNRCGIHSFYIAGESYAPNGQRVSHAWNLVWLDGHCYYTDVTWDDQDGDLFHEYLNLSKEEISKTHFTSDTLPASCGHNYYTYFMMDRSDGICDIRDHKSAEDVANCFVLKSRNGDVVEYYCTIHYHGNDFNTWWNSSYDSIAKKIGYPGSCRYSIIKLGMEYHITFTGDIPENVPEQTDPSTQNGGANTTPPGGNSTATPTQPVETLPNDATDPSATEALSTKPSATEESSPTSPVDTAPTQDVSEPDNTQSDDDSNLPTTPSYDGEKDNSGTVVIVIAIAAVVAAGAAAAWFFIFRKKKH